MTQQNGKTNQLPQSIDPVMAKEMIMAEKQKAQEKRIQDLLSGAAQPPNEMAAYLIQKIQAGLTQGQNVAQQLQRGRAMVQQLETEALRLEGEVEAHLNDLRHWDRPIPTATQKVEDGKKEAPPPNEKAS